MLATRQAGIVASQLQPLVENIGKTAPHIGSDTDRSTKSRQALTVVDLALQDVLLTGLEASLGRLPVTLDAEEETPCARRFHADAGTTRHELVLDPIDGTLDYLEGHDNYSVCTGLLEGGRILVALVYFPARDHAYVVSPRGAQCCDDFALNGLANARSLTRAVGVEVPRVVYVNRRVRETTIRRLAAAGFKVRYDDEQGHGVPDAILATLSGKALAYACVTRQVRDMLLGGVVAGMADGFALDWEGQPLFWPPGARVPHAVFGCWPDRQSLLTCLVG